jgi:carbon monoxide dehydrogenase subunit G
MINEKHARWVLKSQQARTTRAREVEAQFTTFTPNSRAVFEAKGGNLTIAGDCILEPKGNRTELKLTLTFDLAGPLGAIMKPAMSMTIASRVEAFVQCLKEHLEK